MSTRLQSGNRTRRTVRVAAAITVGLGASLTLGGAPVHAQTANSTQVLTEVVNAGTLTIVAPAGFTLTSQGPGTVSAAQPLGALSFTDTLNSGTSWTVSVTATDFVHSGALEIPFTDLLFTAYTGAVTAGPGAVGTPVPAGGSGSPAGLDGTPGTTFGSTPVGLVSLTPGATEGEWTTPADATGNTITVTTPVNAAPATTTATVQYTITG